MIYYKLASYNCMCIFTNHNHEKQKLSIIVLTQVLEENDSITRRVASTRIENNITN